MAAVAGYKGVATWHGNAVANIVDLNHSLNIEEIEVSANGTIYKQFLPGQYDGTASMTLHFDGADTAIDAMYTDALAGTSRAIQLKLDGTTSNMISGTAIITGIETSAGQGDSVQASINFRFTGAITIATA